MDYNKARKVINDVLNRTHGDGVRDGMATESLHRIASTIVDELVSKCDDNKKMVSIDELTATVNKQRENRMQLVENAVNSATSFDKDSRALELDFNEQWTAIQRLMYTVHSANAKWWTNLETGEMLKRNVGEMLMLTVSELAEAGEDSPQYFFLLMKLTQIISRAMEGHRKTKMDDKLPHRTMFECELVDAIIRILDIGGGMQLDLGGAFAEKMAFNAVRKDHTIEARKAADGKKY